MGAIFDLRGAQTKLSNYPSTISSVLFYFLHFSELAVESYSLLSDQYFIVLSFSKTSSLTIINELSNGQRMGKEVLGLILHIFLC